jgi:hypothetical protein
MIIPSEIAVSTHRYKGAEWSGWPTAEMAISNWVTEKHLAGPHSLGHTEPTVPYG